MTNPAHPSTNSQFQGSPVSDAPQRVPTGPSDGPFHDSFARAYEAVLQELGHERPNGTVILSPQQRVVLSGLEALILDMDDNILTNSGEAIHDGQSARFAGGLAIYLAHQGVSFNPQDWDQHFRGCTGRKEEIVYQLICQVAAERYRTELDPTMLAHYTEHYLDSNFDKLMEQVPLSDGALALILAARSEQIPVAICSSSSVKFIQRALSYHNVLEHMHAVVGSAAKKIDEGRYSGNPVRQTCQELGVEVNKVAMIGDSVSDAAALQLAGGKIALMYAPEPSKLKSAFNGLQRFQMAHGEELQPNESTIIVFQSFRQIGLGGDRGGKVSFSIE